MFTKNEKIIISRSNWSQRTPKFKCHNNTVKNICLYALITIKKYTMYPEWSKSKHLKGQRKL